MARQVRYLADEHIAAAVVAGLRSRGIDVSGVREAGLLEASDEVLLAWARAHGRVVVTHDADFLRMHESGVVHAGVAFAARERSVGALIRRLALIAQVLDADDMVGHVEFI